jgi:mRNA interferase MazF
MLIDPNRGEVWRVDLNPTRGEEMQKIRPVIVLSPMGVGRAGLRIVAPIIGWKQHYTAAPWMIELAPDAINGLSKQSAADASQIRAVDLGRFISKLGEMSPDDLETVTTAATLCLGYVPTVL